MKIADKALLGMLGIEGLAGKALGMCQNLLGIEGLAGKALEGRQSLGIEDPAQDYSPQSSGGLDTRYCYMECSSEAEHPKEVRTAAVGVGGEADYQPGAAKLTGRRVVRQRNTYYWRVKKIVDNARYHQPRFIPMQAISLRAGLLDRSTHCLLYRANHPSGRGLVSGFFP